MKKSKKGDDLASELMDDLLGSSDEFSNSKKFDASSSSSAPKRSTNTKDETLDLDENEDLVVDLSSESDDSTLAINDATQRLEPEGEAVPAPSKISSDESTFIRGKDLGQSKDNARSTVGRFASTPMQNSMFGGSEAALSQSENLRLAQRKIIELEREVERLRLENEDLAAAGETFRKKSDELAGQFESLEIRHNRAVESFNEEREVLLATLAKKDNQTESLKQKVEEFESRLQNNIQKIRVRERELENRLELVRMEGAALIRNKDEMILDAKRQLDQVHQEVENYRSKGQELNRNLTEKQELLRRTVKALRLALSMLEGEDDAVIKPLKKAK